MRTPALALALGLLIPTACDDPATREQLSRVKTEFDQAAAELGDLGHELADLGVELGDLAALQAGKLVTAVEGQLATLDGHVEQWKAGAVALGGEAKEAAAQALAVVEQKRQALAAKLAELKDKGGDAGIEVRDGVAEAYEALATAMIDAEAAMRASAEAAPAETPADDG